MLGVDEAWAIFARFVDVVRALWYETMRCVGVSERDCEAIRSAFLYDGLFFETRVEDI